MKLRTTSLFTLITLALVASVAQAGTMTQYGVFPITGGGSGPQIFTSAAAANAVFVCTGTVTNGYSSDSSGTACNNLSGSGVSNNNVAGGTSDKAQTLQDFQFQGFNVAGNTLNSITFQVSNYTLVLSNVNNATGNGQLTYNINNEIQLATSNTQSANLLTNPFYQDFLNSSTRLLPTIRIRSRTARSLRHRPTTPVKIRLRRSPKRALLSQSRGIRRRTRSL